jgi:hypothetical protein
VRVQHLPPVVCGCDLLPGDVHEPVQLLDQHPQHPLVLPGHGIHW